MGMQGEPGLIITRIAGRKVIQQKEWIQIVQPSRRDTSFEPDSRALNDRFRLDDRFDFSRQRLHGKLLSPGQKRESGVNPFTHAGVNESADHFPRIEVVRKSELDLARLAEAVHLCYVQVRRLSVRFCRVACISLSILLCKTTFHRDNRSKG